jgi:beta-lactam-binding protein with PASTA domain
MAFRKTPTPEPQPPRRVEPVDAVDVVEAETVVAPATRRVHEEYVETPPPVRPRHNDIWGWLVAALFAILFILALFWALTRPKTHEVPTVVGLPAATARAELQQKGFDVDVVQVQRAGGGTNVLRQAPNPGAHLEKGAHVAIVVPTVGQVKVPQLVGLKLEAATRLLASLGLKPAPTVVPSDKPKGTVLEQGTAAGTKVPRGTSVPLTIAKGPDLATVPALRGLTQEKAQAQLSAAGLTGVFHQVASPVAPGTVVAQSPAANTKVKADAKVNVNVSSGAGEVSVPDVTQMDEATAVSTLEGLGLKVDLVNVVGASPQGTVVRQDPVANSSVKKGSKVRLSVSDGSAGSGGTTASDTSTSLTG